MDAFRIKAMLGVLCGEEEICVQGVNIDGETFLSFDTWGIEHDLLANGYKWSGPPKDSLSYTDIVPIFDLRAGFDINKDLEHLWLFPFWPHPEVHDGAIVTVCYTIAKWSKGGRTFVTFNLLWIGVLLGDDTLNT
ncbi:hypothetical protein C8J56DRAFT_888997 [Mycena floridula]|nr:hypothetical protein C8J56DRAFT_888997 [Mycena floridula]